MEDIKRVLEEFGLTENEITVYTAALEVDETSPYKLSKATGIPRTTVYDVVSSLALHGLLDMQQSDGFTKQQTLIRAKNPSTLRDIVRERRDELTSLEVDLVTVLQDLKETYAKSKTETNSDVKYYPGVEGVKKVMNLLATDDTNLQTYEFTTQAPMDSLGKGFVNSYIDKRIKLDSKLHFKPKVIMPLNDWSRHVFTYQVQRRKDIYLDSNEHRYIEREDFVIPQEISIKGDFVRIYTVEKEELYGMIVRSRSFALVWKSLFNLIWSFATPITKEVVDSWGENEFLKAERKKID
jgi:predicted transcriptional regulator